MCVLIAVSGLRLKDEANQLIIAGADRTNAMDFAQFPRS